MNIDVTIILITYNHEKCVEKCLESIFNQKTDLNVEVLICDDASVDTTQSRIMSVLAHIVTQFRVRVVFHEQNLGSRGTINADFGLREASGRCVTILNGDDYLVCDSHIDNSYKALTQSVDCAAVTSGHVKIRTHDGGIVETCVCESSKSFQSLAELEFYPLLGASMWRREIIFSVPDELVPYLTDTMLWHFITKHGQGVALPYVSLCYNITGEGVHTSLSLSQAIESHVDLYLKLYQYENSSKSVESLKFWLWWAIEDCGDRGDHSLLKKYSKQLVTVCVQHEPIDSKALIKYKLLILFPFLLSIYKKYRFRLSLRQSIHCPRDY